MGGASLPPGFRFHPTDEELVGYYLQRKVHGLEIELEVIPVIDLYKFDPWELPEKSFLPKRDMEWFFFCPRDRKYPNGSRTNRATKAGYWKATGKDRQVVCQSTVTGYRKTLVFYRGRAPLGDRTDWVMHEYRLCDDVPQGLSNSQGAFALCRIIKKKDQGHKLSDTRKATKAGSSNGHFTSAAVSNEPLGISSDVSSQATYLYNESSYSSPIPSPYQNTPVTEREAASQESNLAHSWVSPDLILDSSKDYAQAYSMVPWHQHENMDFSPSSSYSNFTGEIEHADILSRIGYISPYSGHGNYMGYYDNGDGPYEDAAYDPWEQAPICRQASGDAMSGDYGDLWSQEGNKVIVL